MEGQWSRGMSARALTTVIMGFVPLASLPPICIAHVMLISWLLMNLDRQILPLLEYVSFSYTIEHMHRASLSGISQSL